MQHHAVGAVHAVLHHLRMSRRGERFRALQQLSELRLVSLKRLEGAAVVGGVMWRELSPGEEA